MTNADWEGYSKADPVLFWRADERRRVVAGLRWAELRDLAERVLCHYRGGRHNFMQLMDVVNRISEPGASVGVATCRNHVVGFARPRHAHASSDAHAYAIGHERGVEFSDCVLVESLAAGRQLVRARALSGRTRVRSWRAYEVEHGLSRSGSAWADVIGHPGRSPARSDLEVAVRCAIASSPDINRRAA